MIHWARLLVIGCAGALVACGQCGYAQPIADKNIPVEEKVAISTLQQDDSVQHHIVEGAYEVLVQYEKSMLGIKKLELSLSADQPGQWSDSEVTSGTNLLVKRTGREEPRGCIVESPIASKKDPAADFEAEVIKRVGGPTVSTTRAKNEINRLINQYAQADHVLKLPRSASSRLDPEDTLRRLARWVAYDKLFTRLEMDNRPVATESEAKQTYDQVIALLRGDSLPADESEHRITAEEVQRIRDAFKFTFTVKFTPHLATDVIDQNWRQADQASFSSGEFGRIRWQGELAPGRQSTAWLGFQADGSADAVKISAPAGNKPPRWVLVDGQDDWTYIRLIHTDKKKTIPFELNIVGSNDSSEITIRHSRKPNPKFPF